MIGQSDPVTGVTYSDADNFGTQPVSLWEGIRYSVSSGQYLISGSSGANGLLFEGTLAGAGTSYLVNYPGAPTTSVYGPDDLGGDMGGGESRARRGSWRWWGVTIAHAPLPIAYMNGFLFEAPTTVSPPNSRRAAITRRLTIRGAAYNFVHSTMGSLAVGTYGGTDGSDGLPEMPLGPDHGFIYDICQKKFLPDIVFPGSKSDTAYGIWYNGGTSYTICGGYSFTAVNNLADQDQPIGQGYLVDYNSATGCSLTGRRSATRTGRISSPISRVSAVSKAVYIR